jgi:signal transduction histidine kinase/CheY-like chemotaxis protein
MSEPEHKLGFSFQTKVLVPVLAALILLPAVTLWIVDRYISNQVQEESGHTLATADTVFRQTLEYRARDLLARFSNTVNEPGYHLIAMIAAQHDTPARDTISQFLARQLNAFGNDYEALLITALDNTPQVAARHSTGGDTDGWVKATASLTRAALQGEKTHGTLEFNGQVFLVAALPVYNTEGTAQGCALTVATRISESTLQELKSLTGAEILLIANNAITASSLGQSDLSTLQPLAVRPHSAGGASIVNVEVHSDHYLALSNSYEGKSPQGGFRYVLLSSYEQRLRDLKNTRTTLLGVSFAGILVSGLFIWFLIGRITQPLVELRDNAEAVGRGDFTRRIARFSNDECGAVAVAFNGMTENLQASRAELEKAVGSLKTAQAQLIQSEKLSAVGQFVAGVAHELNNPLTSVIGFADLLQHVQLEPKYQGYLVHISKSATRCHKIVNSLLGFSRQHEPERKPVRLNEIADAVIEIIAYDLRTSNVTLNKEYAPNLPPTLGDAHQLQQVILNIISNARQAIEAFRRDGQITLRTGFTDTQVWMRIKDNGPGIPRDTLSRIFDPFFTTKPQGKGTGLGLSLCYGIMQEHRGSIRAESQPGEGTEFILELPIAEPSPAPSLFRPDSTPPLKLKTISLNVLVVDDEESILHLVQEVLRSEGHLVTCATGGQAALELIGQNRYDVIVSDWKMPGLNGINLFQELLVKDPVAAKRMLFMTGDVIKESFQDFLKKHNRTCLPKPFALREFHSAIARIVHAS